MPIKKVSPPPTLPDLIKQIEAGTDEFRAAATELTKRIVAFEAWLNKLPGKVPTVCWEGADPDGEFVFVLRLRRGGKSWSLHHNIEHIAEESTEVGGLLRDAPVETKIRAIGMFPRLLEKMRQSQVQLVERSTKAVREFDEFATSLGIDFSAIDQDAAKGGK